MIVEGQSAYLLHTRKYTDSRVILDLLTLEYGRISAVHRRPRSKKTTGNIQAFTRLEVDWKGKGGLKTLTSIETTSAPLPLKSRMLYCGLYINEIFERLLAQDDPCESIFSLYEKTIQNLAAIDESSSTTNLEQSLRMFEFALLDELGFGIDFFEDAQQNPIEQGEYFFQYRQGEGFFPVMPNMQKDIEVFPADIVLAMGKQDFSNPLVLKYAKRLCRMALKPHLGSKPIKARELFTR